MKRFFALCVVVLLTACASTTFQEQMSSFRVDEADRGKDLVVIRVADASNPISNGMVIASLEAGVSSTGSQAIVEALGYRTDKVVLGVAGASSALNVATLKRALKDFNGQSQATIYIQADESQIQTLQQIASPKGIAVKNAR